MCLMQMRIKRSATLEMNKEGIIIFLMSQEANNTADERKTKISLL